MVFLTQKQRFLSKNNIFEDSYNAFMCDNYTKNLCDLVNNKNINLIIDVTKINNKYGSEGVTINSEYKKKNTTSISVICDENKIPLSVVLVDVNKINENYKTSKHDVTAIQKTLDNIKINLTNHKIILLGDKGYISNKKYTIENKKITLITYKRKNQIVQNTNKENKLLEKRYKIENLFAIMKNKNRLYAKKERKIINYLSFVYIFMLEYCFNKLVDN